MPNFFLNPFRSNTTLLIISLLFIGCAAKHREAYLEEFPSVSWISYDDLKTGGCTLLHDLPLNAKPKVVHGAILFGDNLFQDIPKQFLINCLESANMNTYGLKPYENPNHMRDGRDVNGRNVARWINPTTETLLSYLKRFNDDCHKQKRIAEASADLCEKNLESLTIKSKSIWKYYWSGVSPMHKRQKSCKKAVELYTPQTHTWQTETVLNRLKKNQLAVNNLIRDYETVKLSRRCSGEGIPNGRPSVISCEILFELLEEIKGSELDPHFQNLGVLSVSRVRAIIKNTKKRRKAQDARDRKAETARIKRLFEGWSASPSSSAGEPSQSCTYKNLMSNLQGWTPIQTTDTPGGARVRAVYFVSGNSNDGKTWPDKSVTTVIKEAGCWPVSVSRIPGDANSKATFTTHYHRVDFD
jgi:hypothetical protein